MDVVEDVLVTAACATTTAVEVVTAAVEDEAIVVGSAATVEVEAEAEAETSAGVDETLEVDPDDVAPGPIQLEPVNPAAVVGLLEA